MFSDAYNWRHVSVGQSMAVDVCSRVSRASEFSRTRSVGAGVGDFPPEARLSPPISAIFRPRPPVARAPPNRSFGYRASILSRGILGCSVALVLSWLLLSVLCLLAVPRHSSRILRPPTMPVPCQATCVSASLHILSSAVASFPSTQSLATRSAGRQGIHSAQPVVNNNRFGLC